MEGVALAVGMREAEENYESGSEGVKPFSESLFKALLLILRSLIVSLYATNTICAQPRRLIIVG